MGKTGTWPFFPPSWIGLTKSCSYSKCYLTLSWIYMLPKNVPENILNWNVCPTFQSVEIKPKDNQTTFFQCLSLFVWKIRSRLHLSVEWYYNFRARNNHRGTIAHKLDTSAISFLCCIKNDVKPWNPIESNGKSGHDRWLFFPSCLCYVNMNQS